MMATRETPSIPAWSQDQLDSSAPPELEAPYFDESLNAWVLSRHADVLTAFRTSSFTPGRTKRAGVEIALREDASVQMRMETMEALSPSQLQVWREALAAEAAALAQSLPHDQPIDLLNAYARPLSLSLAARVTNVSRQEAEELCQRAQWVSAAAADPYDSELASRARSANAELRTRFHSGCDALRDSGFVALSQTIPCILGNVWFALMQNPLAWTRLHRQPPLMDQAIEELLRYAGLVRILFRTAIADADLDGTMIRKGEQLILRVVAANRDPERFHCPNQLDITRRDGGHVALGAAAHSCVGASLIRVAVSTMTRPLLQRFASAIPARSIDWQGGAVFRSPKSLWVHLSEDSE